jgi:hypothetical protein
MPSPQRLLLSAGVEFQEYYRLMTDTVRARQSELRRPRHADCQRLNRMDVAIIDAGYGLAG